MISTDLYSSYITADIRVRNIIRELEVHGTKKSSNYALLLKDFRRYTLEIISELQKADSKIIINSIQRELELSIGNPLIAPLSSAVPVVDVKLMFENIANKI